MHVAGPGEAAVNWVAARQHAVVHREQAERAGVRRTAREGRCRRGTWQRLFPHVYLVGGQPPSDRARIFAAVLDAGWHAAAGGSTAAFAYGLADRLARVIELTMIGRHAAVVRPGVRIHRPRGLTWSDVWFRGGIPVTSPAQTLISLAGTLDEDELEAMCALAFRKRLVSRALLLREINAQGRRPGLPALRAAIRNPALTRSGNERRMLALVRRAELPEPQTNVVVAEKELDLYWPEARLGVEVDAFSTHGSAAAFEDDHKVDADMEAANLRVVRFTGRRIRSRPEAVVAKLAAILALRLGGPAAPAAPLGVRRRAHKAALRTWASEAVGQRAPTRPRSDRALPGSPVRGGRRGAAPARAPPTPPCPAAAGRRWTARSRPG